MTKSSGKTRLEGHPGGTQCCFNVQITLFGRYERQMDIETPLCASWPHAISWSQ